MKITIRVKDNSLFINYIGDEYTRNNSFVAQAFSEILNRNIILVDKTITFKKYYWQEEDYQNAADKYRLSNSLYVLDNHYVERREFIDELKKQEPYDIEVIISDTPQYNFKMEVNNEKNN